MSSLLLIQVKAEKVLLTHAPSQKRAQSGAVLAAMKAKEAEAAGAANAAPGRAAPVSAPPGNATQKNLHCGATCACADIRGEVTNVDGKWKVFASTASA